MDYPSPAEGIDEIQLRIFSRTMIEVSKRLRPGLPLEKIDRISLQHQLREMGQA